MSRKTVKGEYHAWKKNVPERIVQVREKRSQGSFEKFKWCVIRDARRRTFDIKKFG